MKILKTPSQSDYKAITLGLSEDDEHYCLVKKEAEKFTVLWQQKPCELVSFIDMIKPIESFRLIRPVSHQYIWRKTVFLPNTLNQIQLHQQIVQILKNEQPLAIELLNFSYQQFPSSNPSLNKIIIYALRKSYAENLQQIPCILDCELHCYMRAISHLKNLPETDEFPCFSFQQKTVQFTETGIQFLPETTENCIRLEEIETTETELTDTQKHLYFLALGASLWNGKASI